MTGKKVSFEGEHFTRWYLPLPLDEHVPVFRRSALLWNLVPVPPRPILELCRSHFQLLVDSNRLWAWVEFTAALRKICPYESLDFAFSFSSSSLYVLLCLGVVFVLPAAEFLCLASVFSQHYKMAVFEELCFCSLVVNIFTQNVYFLLSIIQFILSKLFIELRVFNPGKRKFRKE